MIGGDSWSVLKLRLLFFYYVFCPKWAVSVFFFSGVELFESKSYSGAVLETWKARPDFEIWLYPHCSKGVFGPWNFRADLPECRVALRVLLEIHHFLTLQIVVFTAIIQSRSVCHFQRVLQWRFWSRQETFQSSTWKTSNPESGNISRNLLFRLVSAQPKIHVTRVRF